MPSLCLSVSVKGVIEKVHRREWLLKYAQLAHQAGARAKELNWLDDVKMMWTWGGEEYRRERSVASGCL